MAFNRNNNTGLSRAINDLPDVSANRIEELYNEYNDRPSLTDQAYDNPMFNPEEGDLTDGEFGHQLSTVGEEDSGNPSTNSTISQQDEPDIDQDRKVSYAEYGPIRQTKQARFALIDEQGGEGGETEPLIESNYESRRKDWDVFRIEPVIVDTSLTDSILENGKKAFKVIAIVVCFVTILFGAAIMKGTFLLASSNIRTNLTLLCRDYNSSYSSEVSTRCVHVPASWEYTESPNNTNISENLFWGDYMFDTVNDDNVPSCLEDGLDEFAIPLGDGPYVSDVCDSMAVRWVWCITLILMTSQMFIFLRCFWYVCFKTKTAPKRHVLVFVMVVETMHTVGVTLFVYRVVPQLHSAAHGAALMVGFSFVPALVKTTCRPIKETHKSAKIMMDMLCVVIQFSAMFLWPIMSIVRDDPFWDINAELQWQIPASLFLISVGWWDNYMMGNIKAPGGLLKTLLTIKKNIRKSRTKIYLWVSFYKMMLIMLLMTIWMSVDDAYDFGAMWDWSTDHCGEEGSIGFMEMASAKNDWLWVWCINSMVGLAVYFCARSAVKVLIQIPSYAVPLTCVTPVVIVALLGMCSAWNDDVCQFTGGFGPPSYMFWSCHGEEELFDMMNKQFLWIVILWWLSQIWISMHVWEPKNERLAKTDKFFNMPLIEPVTIEQWLLHNRTKEDDTVRLADHEHFKTGVAPEMDMDDMGWKENIRQLKREQKREETPMIYFCATLWHETAEEITAILKSIFRSDIDQCARRNAQAHMDVVDPDYYEFETHFFFDDAMEAYTPDQHEYQVNNFVTMLVDQVNVAAREIHQVEITVPPPVKYPAPYGGRLEWILPGGNKMIAHLKDKAKIRHKKRWSQVMYMYYFLGMKLWMSDLKIKKKQLRAENTFVLALDGDVDFHPEALQMLVDLMKKDPKVGAACGRIHPIGNGPMIWYQQFEYALGHWMQKSTEHVLGCVLCSPGCFSLFRGSALMEDNVMCMYTSEPKEAIHYVQYDQGEDRWLCTLLLQAGYKVEYSAAADALTFAPEGFNEFYNQRRRWGPSTMANILDLLMSWRTTVKSNENISLIYIIYQVCLFVSSFLGTGTIFLMIVESVRVAVNYQLGPWESLLINLVPVVIFTFVCFKTKTETQLSVAQILTVMYALLQMLVLVGIIVQIGEEGACSPSGVFFFAVAIIFVVAALVHPQEFSCLIMGMIYFIAIPSMYMLLMMYSLTNLHVINWGTRETVKTKTEIEIEKEKEEEEKAKELKAKEKKNKENGLTSFIKQVASDAETGFTIGVDHIFRFVCCPKPAPPPEETNLKLIMAKLEKMESVLGQVEDKLPENHKSNLTTASSFRSNRNKRQSRVGFSDTTDVLEADLSKPLDDQLSMTSSSSSSSSSDSSSEDSVEKIERDDMVNPFWIENERLGVGPVGKLLESEINFFDDLIQTYLYPIPKDKIKEERVGMELLELRNKVSFSFYLLNAIFVVAIFTLQRNVENIHMDWPCGKSDDLMLEPIGFMFVGFFGIIMLVQFFGMLIHRMGTFLHLVATTNLFRSSDNGVEDKIHLAKDMLVQRSDEDDDDTRSVTSSIGPKVGIPTDEGRTRRKTIYKLQKSLKKEPVKGELDSVFEQRFDILNDQLDEDVEATGIGKRVFNRNRQQRQSVAAIARMKEERRQSRYERPMADHTSSQRDNANDDGGDWLRELHKAGPRKQQPKHMKHLPKRMQNQQGVAEYLAQMEANKENHDVEAGTAPPPTTSLPPEQPAPSEPSEDTKVVKTPKFMNLFKRPSKASSMNSSLGSRRGIFRNSSRNSENSVEVLSRNPVGGIW